MIYYRHYTPKGNKNLKDELIQIDQDGSWEEDIDGDTIFVEDPILCNALKNILSDYDSAYVYASNDVGKWVMLKKPTLKSGVEIYMDGYIGEFEEIKDHLGQTTFDCFINYQNTKQTVFYDINSNYSNADYEGVEVLEFAKILDAILYGKPSKPIIILVDPKEVSNYLSLLYKFLPITIASKISFTTGYDKSEKFQLDFVDNKGERFLANIRLVFLDPQNKSAQGISNSYTYFDIPNHETNYSKKLGIISATINKLRLSMKELLDMACSIQRTFDESGQCNDATLHIELASFSFLRSNSLEDAERLLETVRCFYEKKIPSNYCDVVQKAIEVMLNSSSSDQFDLIKQIVTSNHNEISEIEDLYYSYVMKKCMHKEDEKESLAKWIGRSADRFDELLNTITKRTVTLDFLCKNYFSDYEPRQVMKESLLKIKSYFERNWNCEESLFSLLSKEKSEVAVQRICAVLLCANENDYRSKAQAKERYVDQFIKEFIEKRYSLNEARKKIIFLSHVYEQIKKLNEPTFTDDALYNTSYGREWIGEIIATLDFSEKIQLLLNQYETDEEKSDSEAFDKLEHIKDMLKYELSDITKIKKELVLFDSEVAKLYRRYFYNNLADEERADEIRDWLIQLEDEKNKAKVIKQQRVSFLKACNSHINNISETEFDSSDSENLWHHAQQIASTFYTNYHSQIPQHKKRLFGLLVVLLVTGFSSALLLCVPSIVQCLALDQFGFILIMNRVMATFKMCAVLVPLIAVIIPLACYFYMERIKRRHNIRGAISIALTCVIIPEIVFVISYLVFYFISLRLF